MAFNDNLLRTGIILMMIFGRTPDGEPLTVFGICVEALNPLAAALLIIPFILFSASVGQLADRVSKTRIIRAVKLAEVVIMGIAAAAFVASARGYSEQALAVLVVLLRLAGTQSALNGPAKVWSARRRFRLRPMWRQSPTSLRLRTAERLPCSWC